MKFKLKTLHVFYALLLLLPITICQAGINIEVPGTSGIGKAFLVRIFSQSKFDAVSIKWDGKSIEPSIRAQRGNYEAIAILGIGLKLEQGTYPIRFHVNQDGRIQKFDKAIEIVGVAYPSQKISMNPDLVKPPKEMETRIRMERKAILDAVNVISPERYWDFPFHRPVKGKMLSRFGLHRVFNGETKSRHTGLDFRAWEGTPIHSISNGKVLLVGSFYFSGNFAMIDHGNGLISSYCHMSQVRVQEGEYIKSGQQIGLSGATGRAAGAHLHISMYANGRVIDPEPFFKQPLGSYKQWARDQENPALRLQKAF